MQIQLRILGDLLKCKANTKVAARFYPGRFYPCKFHLGYLDKIYLDKIYTDKI